MTRHNCLISFVALLAFAACGATLAPDLDRLLGEIASGQQDPASYQTLIVENLPLFDNWLKHHWPPNPDQMVNTFLSSLCLEWGDYDEAVFFADRQLSEARHAPGLFRILCEARYSRGDEGVIRKLSLSAEEERGIVMYVQFEDFVASALPAAEKGKWLRKLCTDGGSGALMFLNALFGYPKYHPNLSELDVVAAEVGFFFDFWSDLRISDLDHNIIDPPFSPDKHVFDAARRYFNLSLISLDLAAQYRRLGQAAKFEEWRNRSIKAYKAAEKVKDITPAMRNRYRLTATKLGLAEVLSAGGQQNGSG